RRPGRPSRAPAARAARPSRAPPLGDRPPGAPRRNAPLRASGDARAARVHPLRADRLRGHPERTAMRVRGVDFGLRQLGLALSDSDGSLATPLRSLRLSTVRDAPAAVAAVALEVEAAAVVVG